MAAQTSRWRVLMVSVGGMLPLALIVLLGAVQQQPTDLNDPLTKDQRKQHMLRWFDLVLRAYGGLMPLSVALVRIAHQVWGKSHGRNMQNGQQTATASKAVDSKISDGEPSSQPQFECDGESCRLVPPRKVADSKPQASAVDERPAGVRSTIKVHLFLAFSRTGLYLLHRSLPEQYHVMADHLLLGCQVAAGALFEEQNVNRCRRLVVKHSASFVMLWVMDFAVRGLYILTVWDMYYTARYFHHPQELLVSLAFGYPFFWAAAKLGSEGKSTIARTLTNAVDWSFKTQ